MEGRLAIKRQHEEKSTVKYGDGSLCSIYRQTQPFSTAVSCKKICPNDVKAIESHPGKDGTSFSGSLAEVYEKALNNVLNIQPNFKMEENCNDKNVFPEKKFLSGLESPHFQPPGGCKQLHVTHDESRFQQMGDDKKPNQGNKSAFHVPEKRRPSNGQSRYGNWAHDHSLPYTVNYPNDYYPILHPPPFYPRYDNLCMERYNYYPEPRRREFPVFTHVLPWLQFEKDYKPKTLSPNKSMTSLKFRELSNKSGLGHDHKEDVKTDSKQAQRRPKPLDREDKFTDQKKYENVSSEYQEHLHMRKEVRCDKTADLYNVKTRRMRAVEKRHDLKITNSKKETFGSPQEEFLFSLGLTKVDNYHEG